MANFLLFFPTVEDNEGFYANIPGDSGGETWIGISYNNYPSWPGFAIINSHKINGVFPGETYNDRVAYANKVLKADQKLMALVIEFYQNTEWHTIDGDQIKSDSIADFLGDWCVNCGFVNPIKHLQEIVGVDVDGKFGPGTLAAVNTADAETVFNALKTARISYYQAIVVSHPADEKFLEEWLEEPILLYSKINLDQMSQIMSDMKKVVSYIKSVLSGSSDASSKRVVGVIGAITVIVIVFIDTFTGKAPDEYVLNALISLEMIAFGGVAVENVGNAISKFKQFSKDKKKDDDIDNTGGGIPKPIL